jgi:hypothetical protein
MGVVGNVELVERLLGPWDCADIAFLRGFAFENFDWASFDVSLVVLLQPRPPLSARWPTPNGAFWETEILFQCVRDLRITVTGPWDIETPGFVIEDISAWQWEGIRLRVYDVEGAPVSFNARSASVRRCHPAEAGPACPAFGRQEQGLHPGEGGAA